jgi:hypothetical protein
MTKSLHDLQDELRSVAKELTEPIPRAVVREDRSVTRHKLPSLLDQLRSAVGNGSESGRAGSVGRGNPLPINADATEMLAHIAEDATALHIAALAVDFTPEERIRALTALAGRWTDPGQVAQALKWLKKWQVDINNLLDPPRQLTVTAPCPACDTLKVWREVDGEPVKTWALTVDATKGCTCLACGHNWPLANLEVLAGALGCEPIRNEPLEAAG